MLRSVMANTRVFGARNPRSNRGGATKTDTADSVKLKTTNVMMDKEEFAKYYQSTPHFRIENPNPKWKGMRGFVWDTPDCVIRAIANATGCSWLEAFDYLAPRPPLLVNERRNPRRDPKRGPRGRRIRGGITQHSINI